MTDQRMEPVLESWFTQREIAPADVRHSTTQVLVRIARTRQRSRWWPMPSLHRIMRPASSGQAPAGGSSMFSALKFMTAGVIVALFGGLLLAGVINEPQAEEVLPAAPTATASPEPDANTEADPVPPAEPVTLPPETTTRLASLGLEAVEHEPGVLLIRAADGRDDPGGSNFAPPDIVGLDGSWWIFGSEDDERGDEYPGLRRLGQPKPVPWKRYWDADDGDIEVGPDGTVWARLDKGVVSYDGESWTVHQRIARDERWGLREGEDEAAWEEAHADEDGSIIADLAVSSDGSVWVARLDAGADELEILRLVDDAWRSAGSFEVHAGTYGSHHYHAFIGLAAFDHDLWLATSDPLQLRRYDGAVWKEIDLPAGLGPIIDEDLVVSNISGMRAGPDGTLWLHTLRPGGLGQLGLDYYDGSEWSGWHSVFLDSDEEAGPREKDPDWAPTPPLDLFWGVEALARDGGIWLAANGCGGVYRYVGTQRTHHFLPNRCVHRIAVTPDGDVWLTADKKGNEQSATTRVFLIPAETVATAQPA